VAKAKHDFPARGVPQPLNEALLLYQAETTMMKLTERSLLEAGLSGPQMILLGMLYWDGRALVPRRLRNTIVVEAQTLTGLIDGLENKGLAKRLKHPTDRRKIRVQITPEGRKRYEAASVSMDQTLEDFFKALAPGDRTRLRAALIKLRGTAYPVLGLRDDAAFPGGA
jgi:DNA-binding MarR family transcriptional regulator